MKNPIFEIPATVAITMNDIKLGEKKDINLPKVLPIVGMAVLGVCNIGLGAVAIALTAKKNKKCKAKKKKSARKHPKITKQTIFTIKRSAKKTRR